MTGIALDKRLRDWAEGVVGPITGHTLLSTSNSRVWRATSSSGDWVLKHLEDTSSAPRVESVVLGQLAGANVRRIRALAEQPDGSSFVLAEYVPGVPLADLVPRAGEVESHEWAKQVRRVIDAVTTLPVMGFGKVRVAENSRRLFGEHESWPSFLFDYLERQRLKAPRLARLRYHRLLSAVRAMESELTEVPARLMPADVNLRNYVVDGLAVTCTNIPVVWSGDPIAAYGESVLHWSDTAGEDVFVRAAGESALRRLHLYAAFHAYVILAYVERFSSEPLEEATPWGASTPLLTLFDRHLEAKGVL